MLGRVYRVVEPLGVGGMAAVYLVEHQASRQRLAATVLSGALAANEEACARFVHGAHAASQLQHDHIVSILSLGVTQYAPRSPRASQPPPVGAVLASQPFAVPASQPFAMPPRRLPAPRRRRTVLVVAAAIRFRPS